MLAMSQTLKIQTAHKNNSHTAWSVLYCSHQKQFLHHVTEHTVLYWAATNMLHRSCVLDQGTKCYFVRSGYEEHSVFNWIIFVAAQLNTLCWTYYDLQLMCPIQRQWKMYVTVTQPLSCIDDNGNDSFYATTGGIPDPHYPMVCHG